MPKPVMAWQRYSLPDKGVDNDGDKTLAIKDRTLTQIAKRNMKNVVPLYYEMKKAKGGLLNNESLYEGMSKAFTSGNIGPKSNLITFVHNNGLKDREQADKVVKWLTMEVNFTIDYAKTLYMPTRPKEADEIIKKHTQGKAPNFFIYAKDKERNKVEPSNDSTMNRIANSIPNSRLKFNKSISKFDYRMLMNHNCEFSISSDNAVIKAYDYWNARLNTFSEEDNNLKDQDLMKYKQLRQKIINDSQENLEYITNTLVAYLYTVRQTSAKKSLWACFGDVILKNLKENLVGAGKICPICGKRFKQKRITQLYCSDKCYEKGHKIDMKNKYFSTRK